MLPRISGLNCSSDCGRLIEPLYSSCRPVTPSPIESMARSGSRRLSGQAVRAAGTAGPDPSPDPPLCGEGRLCAGAGRDPHRHPHANGHTCPGTGRAHRARVLAGRTAGAALRRAGDADPDLRPPVDENDDTLSNLVEVHVSNVRKKLGKEFIETRRGQGILSIRLGRLPFPTPTKTTSMASSLRRRLQVWYGLVLLGIVLVFGVLLYSRIRAMRMGGIDVELTALADYLDANLRGIPPEALGEPQAEPRRLRSTPKRVCSVIMSCRRRRSNADSPISTFLSNRASLAPTSLPRNQRQRGLVLRHRAARQGDPQVDAQRPARRRTRHRRRAADPSSRLRDRQFGPAGTHEWTASQLDRCRKSMRGELTELRQLGLQLFGLGAGVVIVGLAGGWWISGLIVSPIRRISEQADAVSEKNLSQRIDVSGIDQEWSPWPRR